MNMIDKLGLTRDGRNMKDFYEGELLRVSRNGENISMRFAFAVVQAPAYNTAASGLPGYEYVQPTLTIRTHRVDLPFAKGDILRLLGRRYTVQTIATEIYEEQKKVSAFVITLSGGQPNDVSAE